MVDLVNSDSPRVTGEAVNPPAPPPVDAATSPEIIPPQAVTLSDLSGDTAGAKTTILNRDGTVRKKPGRKPGQKNAVHSTTSATDSTGEPATLSPATPKTPQEKKAVRLGCDQTARAILGTAVGAMRELVGPEWDFTSQEEADGMRIALAAYIEAKGGGEMSPEVALILVSCGYVGPRFAHENTRTKVGGFFRGAWEAFKGVFSR
jgi:hypothetical protein